MQRTTKHIKNAADKLQLTVVYFDGAHPCSSTKEHRRMVQLQTKPNRTCSFIAWQSFWCAPPVIKDTKPGLGMLRWEYLFKDTAY
jgi:hypothetical protein